MKTMPLRTALVLFSLLCSQYLPAADVVTVYGINPTGGRDGSWIESFNITIDKDRKTATAQEIDSFQDPAKLSRGGGILVVRADVYFANHGQTAILYKTPDKRTANRVFNAATVSRYNGFNSGIADISGDETHIWLNPYDGSNKLFEFVPDPRAANVWKVNKQLMLRNAGNRYDGMEVLGGNVYANRADANFEVTGNNPCRNKRNAIYDKYNAANGNLLKAAFISPEFPASGIAFDGKYFFVSDICNNKIAVYDMAGTFIAEADLGAPPNNLASLCVNPALKRCIEDLSVVVSGTDNPAQQEESRVSQQPVESAPAQSNFPPPQTGGRPVLTVVGQFLTRSFRVRPLA